MASNLPLRGTLQAEAPGGLHFSGLACAPSARDYVRGEQMQLDSQGISYPFFTILRPLASLLALVQSGRESLRLWRLHQRSYPPCGRFIDRLYVRLDLSSRTNDSLAQLPPFLTWSYQENSPHGAVWHPKGKHGR